MQALQKLGFRFDLYVGNVILTVTLRRSTYERRLQTEVPVRIREAKEEFQSYYRRPEPTNHEDEWLDESENGILTRIAFFKWAEAISPSICASELAEFARGGGEHLVRSSRTVCFKATIPPGFGYFIDLDPDSPGLSPCQDPLKYLDRFIAAEEIWGFQTDFVGVAGVQSKFSILIQQDWIAGERATVPEIRQHMFELGFRELQHSFGYRNSLSFYNDEFGVFDLRPANVVKMIEGIIIPIDCFVERLEPKKIQVLESL